eukprot:6193062-Pyramimonas_sp.AAC.1
MHKNRSTPPARRRREAATREGREHGEDTEEGAGRWQVRVRYSRRGGATGGRRGGRSSRNGPATGPGALTDAPPV